MQKPHSWVPLQDESPLKSSALEKFTKLCKVWEGLKRTWYQPGLCHLNRTSSTCGESTVRKATGTRQDVTLWRGDWIVDSEMHENATNLRCFKPHPNNLQNQNRQGTHTTTQLVRDVHSAHKHASNLRGARLAKQILQNFKRHLPWSPSCCTFYHLASLQPGNDRRGSFTLNIEAHYEMLPKITYETYPWFNFQIPSYPGTMTYKYYVDFTILHATSSHSLLSSIYLLYWHLKHSLQPVVCSVYVTSFSTWEVDGEGNLKAGPVVLAFQTPSLQKSLL